MTGVIACFATAEVFKKLIDSIKELVPQVDMVFGVDGLRIDSMDAAHVMMVSVYVPIESFSKYECPQSITIGVSLTFLNRVLGLAGNKDELGLSMYSNGDKLQIMIRAENKLVEYELNTMDIASDVLTVPDYAKLPIVMSSKEFKSMMSDFTVLGADSVAIQIDPKGTASFTAKSESGEVKVTIETGLKCKVPLVTEVIQKSFQIKFLLEASKAHVLSDMITISMSHDDFPLHVSFCSDVCSVVYFLAPRSDGGDD